MAYLTLACRLSLVAVFALSAGGKNLRKGAFAQFAESLRELPLVPARGVAVVTVAAEVMAAATVLLPWTAVAGLVFAGLLLAVSPRRSGPRWRGARACPAVASATPPPGRSGAGTSSGTSD
jgi:hypothetical protein